MNLSITDIKRVAKQSRSRDIRLKLRLFSLVLKGSCVEDACIRLGVSSSYYYFWLRKFKKSRFRLTGLQKRSQRSKRSPNKKK